MKKIFSLTAAVACAVLLSGCNDKDSDYHSFGLTSSISNEGIVMVYSDQPGDVLTVQSTDSWKANTGCDWLMFTESGSSTAERHIDYAYGSAETAMLPLTFAANNTGSVRVAAIRFTANGREAGIQYVQLYFMNVTDPAPSYTDASRFAGATFTKEVEASATSATIAFTLQSAATLASDQNWLTLSETSFAAGEHEVTLTLDPNTTGADRFANLTLLSSTGAKTMITVKQ